MTCSTAIPHRTRLKPLVAAVLLAFGAAADAATIMVTQATDTHISGRCSLREAILANDNQAVPADTDCIPGSGTNDTIEVPFANVTLTQGSLGIHRAVTIAGTLPQRSRIVRDPTAPPFGVLVGTSPLTLQHVEISGGRQEPADNTIEGAIQGGGGILLLGELTLIDTVVSDNSAVAPGGGIRAMGNLTMVQSTISGNHSDDDGGGVFSKYEATIIDSTISGNTSAIDGGGLFAGPLASVQMSNSTIAENEAAAAGGGLALAYGATLGSANATILSSTFVNNKVGSTGQGGAIHVGRLSGLAMSSVLMAANNRGKYFEDIAATDPVTIGGNHNLIRFPSENVAVPGDTATCAPRFGPLSDNGGPTRTVPLRDGPCAIDQGARNSLENDQRGPGYSRVVGMAADIGAFEYTEFIFANGFEHES